MRYDETMSQTGDTYIQTKDLQKSFTVGEGQVAILKDLNIEIKRGDFVIIFGPSGCGKSTLLHTLLGLEKPSGGSVAIDGKDFYSLNDDERAIFRRHNIGIIYQQPLWISSLNVINNVVFTLHLLNLEQHVLDEKAMQALTLVGMDKWAYYRPTELSSGQQQKISLARAMALDPKLIVADEPTGNLDTNSGRDLINTFLSFNDKGITIIMVTHDLEYLKYGNRIIHMIDGEVVEEKVSERGKRFSAGIDGKKTDKDISMDSNVHDRDFLSKLKQGNK